jgi:hypothetical protein
MQNQEACITDRQSMILDLHIFQLTVVLGRKTEASRRMLIDAILLSLSACESGTSQSGAKLAILPEYHLKSDTIGGDAVFSGIADYLILFVPSPVAGTYSMDPNHSHVHSLNPNF